MMKKIISVGIFAILTLSLTGCNWFQPEEPTVEEPEATPASEPYTYENTNYDFALTFPVNWGEAQETKSTQPLMEEAQATVVRLTSQEDPDRYVEITAVDAEDKSNVGDLPATLLEETDNYLFYFNSSGDCYGRPGCEDMRYKTILDESTEISGMFEVM